ncbi:hypothetical protein CDAR_80651 [Caerostris darwini]|uniref:Uncharacterized protein n=1 Tax=Caerostris darwini TaxID=1538125 RepID=A0AAV4PF61_9ARAC|nr:hypothetical protein CDAR_80651 [Caerostris darwini]
MMSKSVIFADANAIYRMLFIYPLDGGLNEVRVVIGSSSAWAVTDQKLGVSGNRLGQLPRSRVSGFQKLYDSRLSKSKTLFSALTSLLKNSGDKQEHWTSRQWMIIGNENIDPTKKPISSGQHIGRQSKESVKGEGVTVHK